MSAMKSIHRKLSSRDAQGRNLVPLRKLARLLAVIGVEHVRDVARGWLHAKGLKTTQEADGT